MQGRELAHMIICVSWMNQNGPQLYRICFFMWPQGTKVCNSRLDIAVIFRFMKAETSCLFFMLELNLVKDVKCHKKGFYRYISNKWKTRVIRSLMSGTGTQLIESIEKVEVLNAFFVSIFTCKKAWWEPRGKSGGGRVILSRRGFAQGILK